jgi:hypothetical protein
MVKYERLPNWCQVCGHMVHEYKDHRDGLHPPQSLVFKNLMGEWSLHVDWRTGHDRSSGQSAGRGGFGQSRGVGRSVQSQNKILK